MNDGDLFDALSSSGDGTTTLDDNIVPVPSVSSTPSSSTGFFSSLLSAASNAFGSVTGANATTTAAQTAATANATAAIQKTMLWVVGGIVVVVLLIGAFVLMRPARR